MSNLQSTSSGAAPAPAASAPAPAPVSEHLAASSRRRLYFRWFGGALILAALGIGMTWWVTVRGRESTDDAYVAGDVVQVTPQIAGTAVAIMAQNTDWVDAGAPLVELDKTDARLTLDTAIEQLAHAVREYRSAHADAERERAQIRLRESDAAGAEADLRRRLTLLTDGGVALEDIRHARDAVNSTTAALEAQRAAYQSSLAHTDGTEIDSNPLVRAAAAQVRSAALALHRTELRAPLTGLITRRAVQVGQRVVPGTSVMAIVPLDRVWVEANFKESQLRNMHAGQAVELHSDLYGNDLTYHGRIEGFEAGTGAAFASLPAQNATGNWIKVVQRVPVRIVLDPKELHAHPLRIGLSMTAEVRVDERADGRAGSAMAMLAPTSTLATTAAPIRVDATDIYRDDDTVGDTIVTQTIRDNSPVYRPAEASAAAPRPGA